MMQELLEVYDQRAAEARRLARRHRGTALGVRLASVVERYELERANLLHLAHQLHTQTRARDQGDPR